MVFLYLNEKQKEKISIFNQFDESIIKEFCRISIESIQKEISPKVFNTAAQRLNLQVQDLKDLIEIITWILVENSRLLLNEKELKDSLTLAGLKAELIDELVASANVNSTQIQTYLENLKLDTLTYNDLEWRIDVKLATKSVRKLIEPEIILKLNLTKNADSSSRETHLLQTDVVNLTHLTNCLDDALNEIKTSYCRRIFKNLV